jgi:hypothetical protein
MSNYRSKAAQRDKLLLELLKTPPKPRPKRERLNVEKAASEEWQEEELLVLPPLKRRDGT